MRRTLVSFLLVALVAAAVPGAVARSADDRSSRTFYVVLDQATEDCALSVDRTLGGGKGVCWIDSVAVTPGLGSETVWMDAHDGLPLSLDVARPIRGSIAVNGRAVWGNLQAGAGYAQLEVTLTGVSEGDEVVIGTVMRDAYVVTPDDHGYEVPFELEPDAALAGARLSRLRLGVAVAGVNANHGGFLAGGRSSVTIPVVRRGRA